MKKIAIIGSAGAGKTTLARELASRLHVKVVHLDRLFWKRNWIGKSRGTRVEIMDHLVLQSQWIIEGTYIDSSESRLNAADTIIFLDTSPFICLVRIIKRHRPLLCLLHKIRGDQKYHRNSRRDIPEGSIDKLSLFRIFKVLAFPFQERRKLKKNLRKYKSKNIILLHSTKEVTAFLAQFEPDTDKEMQCSETYVVGRKDNGLQQDNNQDSQTSITTRANYFSA